MTQTDVMTANKRSWTVTIPETQYEKLGVSYDNFLEYVQDKWKDIVYVCWNEERYPEPDEDGNNRHHMHAYFEFTNPKTGSAFQKKGFKNCHIEYREGTPTELRRYIMKEEGVKFGKKDEEKSHVIVHEMQEWGDWSKYEHVTKRGNGQDTADKKNIKQRIAELLNDATNERELKMLDPWIFKNYEKQIMEEWQYRKQDEFIKNHCVTFKANDGTEVVKVNLKVMFLYGKPNDGKTLSAMLKGGRDTFKAKVKRGMGGDYEVRMEGYKGEGTIIIDECNPNKFPTMQYWNDFLDEQNTEDFAHRYYDRARMVHTVIFVANYPIEEFYSYEQRNSADADAYGGFLRRFNGGVWEMEKIKDPNGDRSKDKRKVYSRTPWKKLGENWDVIKEESPVDENIPAVYATEEDKKRAFAATNTPIKVVGSEVPF